MPCNHLLRALLVVAGLASMTIPAFATPIQTGTWYCGRFGTMSELLGGSTEALSSCPVASTRGYFGDPGDQPWVVVVGSTGGTLIVVDVQVHGDRFELFDMRSSIGHTSKPLVIDFAAISDPDEFARALADASSCGNIVDCALNDSRYSSGRFNLTAGEHQLSGLQVGEVNAGDFAFIVRNNTSVPAPATFVLFGAALGLLGLRSKPRC